MSEHVVEKDTGLPDGFAWCDARWPAADQRGDHVCAAHGRGHVEHRCCCGSTHVTPSAVTDCAPCAKEHPDAGCADVGCHHNCQQWVDQTPRE